MVVYTAAYGYIVGNAGTDGVERFRRRAGLTFAAEEIVHSFVVIRSGIQGWSLGGDFARKMVEIYGGLKF